MKSEEKEGKEGTGADEEAMMEKRHDSGSETRGMGQSKKRGEKRRSKVRAKKRRM